MKRLRTLSELQEEADHQRMMIAALQLQISQETEKENKLNLLTEAGLLTIEALKLHWQIIDRILKDQN